MKKLFIKDKLHKIFSFLNVMIIIFTIMLANTTTVMAAGTNTISDVTGVTRDSLLSWLESHESDTYYLTTPYKPYDWRSPNGDPSFNGTPGMNCTGFVWHALTAAGGSGVPGLSDPRWWTWIVNNDIERYDFATKDEMLLSGILEKGDIIWIWDESVGRDALSDFHHVGFYWGNTSSDDLFWHSTVDNVISWIGYNRITNIYGKVSPVSYTVLKLQNSGYIDLMKQSANPSISNSNACYSLQGAVYTIFRDLQCTQIVTTMTTDNNGYAAPSISLAVNTYYVKETSPALGYALDSTVYTVQVLQNQTTRVNAATGGIVYDKPQNNQVHMFLEKIDSETTDNTPQSGASLENAHFEVKYFDGYYSTTDQSWIQGITPKRVWVVKTDENGVARLSDEYLVSGDPFYYDSSGAVVTLPLGTVTIQEIKASEGYLLGNQPIFIMQITSNNSLEFVDTFNAPEAPEQIKRGDLKLVKAEAGTFTRLANVQFKITSKTNGESHIIVTDSNGFASTESSWNPHTQNTNRGTTADDGVWFGEISAIRNDVGALPYDTYSVEELRGSFINFRPLIPPFDITISRDNYTVDLGTLLNDAPIIPQIGTTAIDGYTEGNYISADSEAIITDTISYSNLISNREYTIVGILMDKATWTPIQVNGRNIRVEQMFTATDTTPITSGTMDMIFNFDASSLGGKDVVVFEFIYYEDTLIGSHEDIDDDDQTVHILNPAIGTTATDGHTGENVASADMEAIIIDTVRFENLIVGKTYTMNGVLMDKSTGDPVLINGGEVTAEKTFTPETTNGTVDMTFTFDASSLGDKDIVVFEHLIKNEISVASHTDINDQGQTITFMSPQIATTVKDGYADTKIVSADIEAIIIDTVHFENLIPGKEYTLKGRLMNKETASPILIDSSEITSEVTFVPDAADGEVEMTFNFNARSLGGSSIVVFEYLYKNDIEITMHTDLNDEDQTVIVKTPNIATSAFEKTTGVQEAVVDDWVTVIDTVHFTGLIPGKPYYLDGKLMDKSTGKVIISDGKEITSYREFVPDAPDGEIEMIFNFNVHDLEGQDIVDTVVFENLYKNNIEVATHADINDSSQTVKLIKPPSLPGTGEIYNFNLLHNPITIITVLIASIIMLIIAGIMMALYYLRNSHATLMEGDVHNNIDELISDSKDKE